MSAPSLRLESAKMAADRAAGPQWTGAELVGCGWCGGQHPLAGFDAAARKCELAARSGQRSMFGGARGLFDALDSGFSL